MSTATTVIPRTYRPYKWTDGTYRSVVQPPGFLASGHYLPALQPMVAVYPRPDNEASPNARHHFAFYDGTNPMLYDVPLGVIGGSYPYVCVLMSGPSWLSLVMPDYSVGPPYGSPRLQGIPTGTGTWTVWVRFYGQDVSATPPQILDIQYTLSTSSDISNGGVFIFANKDTGLSTNTGAYASPIDDTVTAFGTTLAAAPTIGGVATAGKILVLQESTKQYTLPIYNVNTFTPAVAQKPIAMIGMPNANVVYDGAVSVTTQGSSNDFFMSSLNPNGYDITAGAFSLIFLGGGGGETRFTVDKMNWTNSGWGNVTEVTASISGTTMTVTEVLSGNPIAVGEYASINGVAASQQIVITALGTGTGGIGTYTVGTSHTISSQTFYIFQEGTNSTGVFSGGGGYFLRPYIFVNEFSEINRQTGQMGNNYALCDLFNCSYSLVQGAYLNSPNTYVDAAAYLKSDLFHTEVRGCFVNVQGCDHAFDFGQAPENLMGYADSTYNVLINGSSVFIPQVAALAYGPLRLGRSNYILGGGIDNSDSSGGPYYLNSCAYQMNSTLPTGGQVINDGLNIVEASGLIDATTGLLTSAYASNIGTVGAQIA